MSSNNFAFTVLLTCLLLGGSGLACAQDASAAPSAAKSRSLLPSAQPMWSDLTESQKQTLIALENQWYTLPTAERLSWVNLANRIPKMAPDQKVAATNRINDWAKLTFEQRRLARANFRLAKELSQEERTQQWNQYQTLTPEQQAVLRKNGWTSTTAARHAGSTNGLAKEASQPIKEINAKVNKPIAATALDSTKR